MKNDHLLFCSNIAETIPVEEYDSMDLQFVLLDAMARITNASMFVVDFSKRKMVYRTDNLLFVDEATTRDIQRESTNPYWALIHDEDLDLMLEARDAYLKLFDKLSIGQRQKHTFVIDTRIILHRRAYVITQKFTPLKLRPDGKLWLGLFCMTTSSNKNVESKHMAVFGEGFRYVYNQKNKSFQPLGRDIQLTLMEKAILLRASKGLTLEQIAQELYKSVNTIKTHRSRLFNKLQVNSMREALIFVSNYNLY